MTDFLPMPAPSAPPPAELLTEDDRDTLRALALMGTPVNTRRAYARDLAYLDAWAAAATGGPLPWPVPVALVRKFIAHHLFDPVLRAANPRHGMPAAVEAALIAAGAKQRRGPHSPATVRRRLATLATLHRHHGLHSPTADPAVRTDLARAVRAAARPRRRKSANAITADLLDRLVAGCDDSLRGVRDRALLLVAFASGGRRRSELAALTVEQLVPTAQGWLIAIRTTKTTTAEAGTLVPVNGAAARALGAWLDRAGIADGPLFRAIDRWGRPAAALSAAGIAWIVKQRLAEAGLDARLFSAHGLRAGFLTEAGRRRIHLQDAMALSLHKSIRVAAGYYDAGALPDNPAASLLDG